MEKKLLLLSLMKSKGHKLRNHTRGRKKERSVLTVSKSLSFPLLFAPISDNLKHAVIDIIHSGALINWLLFLAQFVCLSTYEHACLFDQSTELLFFLLFCVYRLLILWKLLASGSKSNRSNRSTHLGRCCCTYTSVEFLFFCNKINLFTYISDGHTPHNEKKVCDDQVTRWWWCVLAKRHTKKRAAHKSKFYYLLILHTTQINFPLFLPIIFAYLPFYAAALCHSRYKFILAYDEGNRVPKY